MKLPSSINGNDISVVIAYLDEGHTAEQAADLFGVKLSSMLTYISTFKSLDLLGGGTSGNVVTITPRGHCANPRCRRRIRWRIRLCWTCDEKRRSR